MVSVEELLDLVLTGDGSANLAIFYRFGSRVDGQNPRMQFPLCYINALLEKWFRQDCFSSLYREITTYGAKLKTGLDWETLVQYAVMMRCVYASKCADNNGPFNNVPSGECPKFRFIPVPGEHETVDALIGYVNSQLIDCTKPTLVMVNSQFSNFPTFDGFVWYHTPAKTDIVGYQCKLGRTCTSWDVPSSVNRGFLIRGLPAQSSFEKANWQYLSKPEIKQFLGFSLEHLIPDDWPKVE